MKVKPLKLVGTHLVLPAPKHDERGYFMRTWDDAKFHRFDLRSDWVQENQSYNRRRGIIRGLHFQKPPHAETKLVRVVLGTVLDVFVDLRDDSETYGQWDAVELSAENQHILYLPKGFAHGYCTLTEESMVLYKVDAYYAPQAEGGIRWNDESLNIPWPVGEPLVSKKDQALPRLCELASSSGEVPATAASAPWE